QAISASRKRSACWSVSRKIAPTSPAAAPTMSASSASTSRLPWPSAAYDVLVIGDLNRTQRQVTTMAIRGQHGFLRGGIFLPGQGALYGETPGAIKMVTPYAISLSFPASTNQSKILDFYTCLFMRPNRQPPRSKKCATVEAGISAKAQ